MYGVWLAFYYISFEAILEHLLICNVTITNIIFLKSGRIYLKRQNYSYEKARFIQFRCRDCKLLDKISWKSSKLYVYLRKQVFPYFQILVYLKHGRINLAKSANNICLSKRFFIPSQWIKIYK